MTGMEGWRARGRAGAEGDRYHAVVRSDKGKQSFLLLMTVIRQPV